MTASKPSPAASAPKKLTWSERQALAKKQQEEEEARSRAASFKPISPASTGNRWTPPVSRDVPPPAPPAAPFSPPLPPAATRPIPVAPAVPEPEPEPEQEPEPEVEAPAPPPPVSCLKKAECLC